MKTSIAIWGILGLIAVSESFIYGQNTETNARNERVAAPVVYHDLVLIVSTKAGVAAIDFDKAIENGITYRYRFCPTDTVEEQNGTGKVFEIYRRFQNMIGATRLVDDGSQLWIEADEIRLEWSFGGPDRGWVYYSPENTRVQIANSKKFAELQLSQFAWSNK